MTRVLASEPRHDAEQPVAGAPEPRPLAHTAAAFPATGLLMLVGVSLAVVSDRLALVRRAFPDVRETVALIGDEVTTRGGVALLSAGRRHSGLS